MKAALLFSGEVTLEVACEILAELRDFKVEAVLKAVRLRGPLLFFEHARQNGDGSWRVPACDVRALLGDVPERAVSAKTFAGWCELKAPKTVRNALKRGELRHAVFLGQLRIPVSEYLRLLNGGGATGIGSAPGATKGKRARAGRPSFFGTGVCS